MGIRRTLRRATTWMVAVPVLAVALSASPAAAWNVGGSMSLQAGQASSYNLITTSVNGVINHRTLSGGCAPYFGDLRMHRWAQPTMRLVANNNNHGQCAAIQNRTQSFSLASNLIYERASSPNDTALNVSAWT